MAFREFTGALDGEQGFVEFNGELDDDGSREQAEATRLATRAGMRPDDAEQAAASKAAFGVYPGSGARARVEPPAVPPADKPLMADYAPPVDPATVAAGGAYPAPLSKVGAAKLEEAVRAGATVPVDIPDANLSAVGRGMKAAGAKVGAARRDAEEGNWTPTSVDAAFIGAAADAAQPPGFFQSAFGDRFLQGIEGAGQSMLGIRSASLTAARRKAIDEGASPEVVDEFDRQLDALDTQARESIGRTMQLAASRSPETAEFFREVDGEDGLDTLKRLGSLLVSSPTAALRIMHDIGMESMPQSLAIMAAAMAAPTITTAAVAGGGASALMEFGNQYAALRREGIDHDAAWNKAAATGAAVGLFDGVSIAAAGAAGRTILAQPSAAASVGSAIRESAKQMPVQMALGGGGAAWGQILSGQTGQPGALQDIGAEILGEGNPLSTATEIVGAARPGQQQAPDLAAGSTVPPQAPLQGPTAPATAQPPFADPQNVTLQAQPRPAPWGAQPSATMGPAGQTVMPQGAPGFTQMAAEVAAQGVTIPGVTQRAAQAGPDPIGAAAQVLAAQTAQEGANEDQAPAQTAAPAGEARAEGAPVEAPADPLLHEGKGGRVLDEEQLQRRNLAGVKLKGADALMGADNANMFAQAIEKEARESFDAEGRFIGKSKYRVVTNRGVFRFDDLDEAKAFADSYGQRQSKPVESNQRYAEGMEAAKSGKPRDLPVYIGRPRSDDAKAWFAGWDAGKTPAPSTATPSLPAAQSAEAVDKSPEMQGQPVDKPADLQGSATHKDPGQPAEPVTAEVIREAVQKSADRTPLDLAGAKKNLLAMVDKAIAEAPNAEAIGLVREFKRGETGQITKVGESKAPDAMSEGGEAYRAWLAENVGYVKFDVPGDGTFSVLNLKDNLQQFRKRVEGSAGFKAAPKAPPKPPKLEGTITSNPAGTMRDMLVEGEIANGLAMADALGAKLAYGAGRDGEVNVYTDAEDVKIGENTLLVGQATRKFGVGKRGETQGYDWHVIEPSTGMSAGSGKTAAIAVDKARDAIARLKQGGKTLAQYAADTAKKSKDAADQETLARRAREQAQGKQDAVQAANVAEQEREDARRAREAQPNAAFTEAGREAAREAEPTAEPAAEQPQEPEAAPTQPAEQPKAEAPAAQEQAEAQPAAEAAPKPEPVAKDQRTAEAALARLNADDAEGAAAIVRALQGAELEKVGQSVNFPRNYQEGVGAFRDRMLGVLPEFTKTRRETTAAKSKVYDRLVELAKRYDDAVRHVERARENGAAPGGTAFEGGFEGKWFKDIETGLLPYLRAEVDKLRDNPHFKEMREMVAKARPAIFDAAPRAAAQPAAPKAEAQPEPLPDNLSAYAVEVPAVDPKTGARGTITERADQAMTRVDDQLAKAKALLECLLS